VSEPARCQICDRLICSRPPWHISDEHIAAECHRYSAHEGTGEFVPRWAAECDKRAVDWQARARQAEKELTRLTNFTVDISIVLNVKANAFMAPEELLVRTRLAICAVLDRLATAEAERDRLATQVAKDQALWKIADDSDELEYLRGAKALEEMLANPDYFGLPERYARLLHRDVAPMLGERDCFRTAIECVLADLEGNADSRSRGNFTMIETNRIEVLRLALAAKP